MQCPKCLKLLDEKDFFGKRICYKCIYKEKVKQIPKFCKVCKIKIESPRNKYCSEKCLKEMNRKRTDSHWTRHISILSISWNNHEFYSVKNAPEF